MQLIPTNDVFKHLLLILRIHKDKALIIRLFKSEHKIVSKSQIKAWQTGTGQEHPGYREMPREMLNAFFSALHKAKLVHQSTE